MSPCPKPKKKNTFRKSSKRSSNSNQESSRVSSSSPSGTNDNSSLGVSRSASDNVSVEVPTGGNVGKDVSPRFGSDKVEQRVEDLTIVLGPGSSQGDKEEEEKRWSGVKDQKKGGKKSKVNPNANPEKRCSGVEDQKKGGKKLKVNPNANPEKRCSGLEDQKKGGKKSKSSHQETLYSVLGDSISTPKWDNDGFLTQKYRKIIRNIIKNVNIFLAKREYYTFRAASVVINTHHGYGVTIKDPVKVDRYFECRRGLVDLMRIIFTHDDLKDHPEAQDFIDHASSMQQSKFLKLMYHPVLHSMEQRSNFPVEVINRLRRHYSKEKQLTKLDLQYDFRKAWGKKKIWPEHFHAPKDVVDVILTRAIVNKATYPRKDAETAVRFARNVLVHIETMFKHKHGVESLPCVRLGGWLALRYEVVKRLYTYFPQVWTLLYSYAIDCGVDLKFNKYSDLDGGIKVQEKKGDSEMTGSSSEGGSKVEYPEGKWEEVTKKKKGTNQKFP